MKKVLVSLILLSIMASGCKYHRGNRFVSRQADDSLVYVLQERARGEKLLEKVTRMTLYQESKGNTCDVRYAVDTVALKDQKGFLLLNITLPNVEEDMLTKGYFGALASRQHVIMLVLNEETLLSKYRKLEY